MTNREKFKDYLDNWDKNSLCDLARKEMHGGSCEYVDNCTECSMKFLFWLDQESEEKIDWSEVPEGTMIEVSAEGVAWHPRVFSHLYKGNVYTRKYDYSDELLIRWEHARLRK